MIPRAVVRVARREFLARVRTRAFALGTALTVLVLAGYLLLQALVLADDDRSTVGLSGQATALAEPLTQAARARGHEVITKDVTDVAAGEAAVRDGDLDALVSGSPAALRVLVESDLDIDLRSVLDGLQQQQVLLARLTQLAQTTQGEVDPQEVLDTALQATVDVTRLEPVDAQRGERLAVALLAVALLYFSLLLYGTQVAQGVVEEKSSRVVEMLLSTVRSGQLLAGKVLGIGLAGLLQLTIIGVIGVVAAAVSGALTISGSATVTLLWALLWYVLGYALYACAFAAVGSLVSRQEDAQGALVPVNVTVAVVFVVGFTLLTKDAEGTLTTVLSLLPPFAPIMMPGRIALGAAPFWQVALALLLVLGAIALLAVLAGRVYRNAVLHTGSRMRLRDALRA